jgi:DNA-binding NarL/FixJ family response regulator
MIKVMVVDDQEVVREGLKMILSLHQEIEVVGEAANGESMLSYLRELAPDVILMDIRMPVMDGITAAKLVKEKYPEMKVIILTTFNENEYIINGLSSGIDGYLLKDAGSAEIMNAIKAATAGNVLLTSRVTERMVEAMTSGRHVTGENANSKVNHDKLAILTPREVEVARLVLSGDSNKSIAQTLFVTEGTIKNYVSRILEKLECRNRTELCLLLSTMGPF